MSNFPPPREVQVEDVVIRIRCIECNTLLGITGPHRTYGYSCGGKCPKCKKVYHGGFYVVDHDYDQFLEQMYG